MQQLVLVFVDVVMPVLTIVLIGVALGRSLELQVRTLTGVVY
jgi:predicted permease